MIFNSTEKQKKKREIEREKKRFTTERKEEPELTCSVRQAYNVAVVSFTMQKRKATGRLWTNQLPLYHDTVYTHPSHGTHLFIWKLSSFMCRTLKCPTITTGKMRDVYIALVRKASAQNDQDPASIKTQADLADLKENY